MEILYGMILRTVGEYQIIMIIIIMIIIMIIIDII